MLVNKQLIDILNNYSLLNSMCYFDGTNVLKTRSSDNTIFAEVIVPEFIDTEFAFYDIGQINKLLSEGSEISVKNNTLNIKNENYNIKYRLSNIEKVKERVLNNYRYDEFSMTTIFEFYLNDNNFKKLLNISSKIDNDTCIIKSKNDKTIIIETIKKGTEVTNEFSIEIDVDHVHTDDVFTFMLDRFKFINAKDYKIQVGYRVNNSGVKIPLMKSSAIYNNNINVKYIVVANR